MKWFERQKERVLDQKAKVVKFYQRGRYGVSYEDEFSLDYYLARILLQSLPKYKNDGEYGEFVVFTDPDYVLEFDNVEEDPEYVVAMDTWDAKIDAVWSALYDQYESDDYELQYKYKERFTASMEVFSNMFWALWW